MTTQDTFEQWREARNALIYGPHGYVALAEQTFLFGEGEVEGVPGFFRPTDAGLEYHATASDNVTVDGEPFDGKIVLRSLHDENPTVIGFEGGFAKIETEAGYSVQRFEPSRLEASPFADVEIYPYDPELVVEARFRQLDNLADTEVDLLRGGQIITKAIGYLDFDLVGKSYSLLTYRRREFFVVSFFDETIDLGETKLPGRALNVTPVRHGETVTIDFNRAGIKPCAVSDIYNCPLPVETNRIHLPVRAGERRPV